MVTIQVLSFQVMTPVMQLIQAMSETQRGLASLDRVREVLAMERELPDRPHAQPAPRQIESLEIDSLWFRYPPRRRAADSGEGEGAAGPVADEDEAWVLRDISLRVEGGQVVALVGESGAGKSTLSDLITRMIDPTRGAIRLNGVDIRDYRLHSYRSLLGVVSQETFLFDGTVRDNLAYGNRHADEAAVIRAARQARAWDFICDLPDGLDTFIGERGVKVSGGQRQRLAIARAILADPALLILDEATSSLDSANEQAIQASLQELMRGRTTVVVAHRLSTIRDANQIIVLAGGSIVERGCHQELMAKGPGGAYFDMVQRQQLAAADGVPVGP
ncbi:MAG: ATP-binding cassette domain-containing protein [Planctomycetota bacterium]|nr:MAG: ATP-binding cassette domain-containing protein [Planctomycetota bacterium]